MIPEHNAKLFPAGIVLSGGVAKTPGIDNLLADVLKMPVRVADPQEYYQMPPGRIDTSYVNATGVIRYILSKERNPYSFIDAPKSLWDINDLAPRSPSWDDPEQQPRHRGAGEVFRNIMEKIKESFKDLF
jgi:cell division protein FtsA